MTMTSATGTHSSLSLLKPSNVTYVARCPKCGHKVIERVTASGEITQMLGICYDRRHRCKENGVVALTLIPLGM